MPLEITWLINYPKHLLSSLLFTQRKNMSSVGSGVQQKVNYSQETSAIVTINAGATLPATVVSVTITTTGKPVQIMASGDANPLSASWGRLRFYRDNVAIGQIIQFESSLGNENNPYALTYIDAPAAGTYTYSVKMVASGSGDFQFGEGSGNNISCLELWGNV